MWIHVKIQASPTDMNIATNFMGLLEVNGVTDMHSNEPEARNKRIS